MHFPLLVVLVVLVVLLLLLLVLLVLVLVLILVLLMLQVCGYVDMSVKPAAAACKRRKRGCAMHAGWEQLEQGRLKNSLVSQCYHRQCVP